MNLSFAGCGFLGNLDTEYQLIISFCQLTYSNEQEFYADVEKTHGPQFGTSNNLFIIYFRYLSCFSYLFQVYIMLEWPFALRNTLPTFCWTK
jgi:hypothetical protein